MLSIGIDIGTTGLCAVLLDSDTGRLLLTSAADNDSFIASDKPWEKIQDAEKIRGRIFEITDNLFSEARKLGKSVASIGISNQMHGIVYTDADGNAVSPFYIWQDERGNLTYKDGKSYAEHLGGFAGYGLITDFYNRENGLVPENAVFCCTVGDYLAMQLCGTKKPLMHISNAAGFGCFDLLENRFTVDNGMLPVVTDSFETVGSYRGAKVSVAVGDNQASFIGSVSGDMPLVNVGTGSQVSYLTDAPVFGENIESRPYDGKRFLAVGSSLCGGRAFSLLERFYASVVEMATGEKCGSLYPQLNKMLEKELSTDMTADSRFCGTRANPGRRASFSNISQENFRVQDMTVAMLYAIAGELKSMYSGGKSEKIVCSGNGIRKNAALRQIVSRVFGAQVLMPSHLEEAAYGSALTSMVAVGEFADLAEAQKLIEYR